MGDPVQKENKNVLYYSLDPWVRNLRLCLFCTPTPFIHIEEYALLNDRATFTHVAGTTAAPQSRTVHISPAMKSRVLIAYNKRRK